MAPPAKKAKTAAKPPPGSGLQKFFGGSKSGELGTTAQAQAPPPEPTPAAQPAVSSGGGLTEAQKQKIEENRRAALERKQGLSEAQKQKIEENRRAALARKQAKEAGTPMPPVPTPQQAVVRKVVHDFDADDGHMDEPDEGPMPEMDMPDDLHVPELPMKSPSPMKAKEETNKPLKRNGSDITPEKTTPPKKQTPAKQDIARVLPITPAVQDGAAPLSGADKFKTFGKVSWVQYNTLYAVRLQKLRDVVLAQAKSRWSNEVPAANFLSSIGTSSMGATADVVFVGVAFKSMPSRDNVIEQYRDCMVATSTLPEDDVDKQTNLCSDADVAFLEDTTFRIELELKPEQVAKFATGLVMAVRGSVTADGKFATKDFCLAQGSTATPLPKIPQNASPGPYVALLSGLFIGAPDEDVKARNRAVDFLLGKGQTGKMLKLSKALKHVIVCGGVYWTEKLQDVPAGIEAADDMFSQLAEKLPVDVLPGHKDPSNLSLPQMPLHPFFFRSAQKSSQFKSVSNPYECTLDDLEIVGHAGQPLRDLMRCTSIKTPMEALATCLDASLVAPTAPDTLATQSFRDMDPFIIDGAPKLLFSGGHSECQYEWRTTASGFGTMCVCVPAFNKKPSVVLVNLRNPQDILVQNFDS